jgi:hypothetical protein
MGTSHEDLHAFLREEVTIWGIPNQLHNHVGNPRESSVMMSLPTLRKNH